MAHAFGYLNCHASMDRLALAVENYLTFTVNKCPDFITTGMILIADRCSGIECEMFGQCTETVGIINIVDNLISAPAALFVHGTALEPVGKLLDIFAAAFLRDKNTIG